ncbi:TPA: LPXTG cell wall anchor domain-containing protein [Streptococcus suis]|nr:LPXTG cell wall anchor domain-containing protein [Streptococcus suis]HEL1616161.1 LPXTG cell wall anchor domain-containing protein [Streptococcus suis]
MQVKKFAKWGLALTSTLVLGGAIAPVGNQLLGGSAVVYAQDGAVFEPYVVEFYIDGEYWGVANRGYNSGWPYVRLEPYSEEFPGKEWPSEELGGFTSNLPNVSVVTKEDLDSIGSVVKVYWTRKPVETLPVEQPTEQPVATPADQPVEQPVEQPAEQPVDTPTDKPVEQLTDASSLTDQPAGKVQAVTATDKKTVDKSAPSTPAVKPEEVSQPVAKTLPKTGDSSSMLLVLGGVLSGLSGLGLAATSRKRD